MAQTCILLLLCCLYLECFCLLLCCFSGFFAISSSPTKCLCCIFFSIRFSFFTSLISSLDIFCLIVLSYHFVIVYNIWRLPSLLHIQLKFHLKFYARRRFVFWWLHQCICFLKRKKTYQTRIYLLLYPAISICYATLMRATDEYENCASQLNIGIFGANVKSNHSSISLIIIYHYIQDLRYSKNM